MPELNADIPDFDCFVRSEFLYDLRSHKGEFTPARAFGLCSLSGRALGFHVMTDVGAVVWRLPIHAVCTKRGAPPVELDHAQLWDCFSYHLAVTEFAHLEGRACCVLMKDGSRSKGTYLFTVDWYGTSKAEGVGDGGHKCAHVIELDNGCLVAQPNNRLLFADPATISNPFEVVPGYLTNTHTWRCEGEAKWATEDTNRAFYGTKNLDWADEEE